MNGLCVDMAYQLSAPFKSCASSPPPQRQQALNEQVIQGCASPKELQ